MLLYVRHGQTVWNRQQRLQGRGDSPLTLWGVELAIAYGNRVREVLAGRDVRIYSSPMGRARQTAAIVADSIGVGANAVMVEALLAEHDVGRWSGRTWDEIERDEATPREVLRGLAHRPPDGETRLEMFERATRWLARPRDEVAAVLVSHGGFSRMFRGAWLGLTPESTLALPTHQHGRVYILERGRIEEIVADETPPPAEAALG